MTLRLKLLPLLVLWIVAGSFNCTPKQNEVRATLRVHIGCDDSEIVSDIIFSAQSIEDSLRARGVTLSVDSSGVDCGYIFVRGKTTKVINHALTNAELWDSSNAFFGTDI